MEMMEGMENLDERSPQAKKALLEVREKRAALAPRNENVAPAYCPPKGGKFEVFCDEDTPVLTSTQNSKPGLSVRADSEGHNSSGYASGEPLSNPSNASHSQVLLTVPDEVLGNPDAGVRLGSQALFNDSNEADGSSMVLEVTGASELDEDVREKECASSVSSAYTSAASSSYYTAPLAPDSLQLHRELVTCCPRWATAIFSYLLKREMESALRVSPSYMAKQSELTPEMRRTLMDWLVDVSGEYGLDRQTLHLSIRFVDRFLSFVDVPRHKLQLVGTTAVMIAAKLEEIYPPELKEFVYITDDTYTIKQVKRMERLMLETLQWELNCPTPALFAARFVQLARLHPRTGHLVDYLVDLSILSLDLSAMRPSLVASAAVCLASLITEVPEPWPETLIEASGVGPDASLLTVCRSLAVFARSVDGLTETALPDKYANAKYHSVSRLQFPDPDEIQLSSFS